MRDYVVNLEAENRRFKAALEEIRNEQGKVCGAYEICTHLACQSSYAAWAIADKALHPQTCARHEGHGGGELQEETGGC